MTTQTVEFGAPANQTVTARLFAAGSDTVVATATATARTNATGVYTAAYTDLAPGLYRLIGTNAVGTLLCQWWVRTLAATGTYPATETPDADSLTLDRMGYLDGVLIAANYNQRTVSVTGSNHVAADIHELQAGVITASDFAPNAIDADALAADAVAEIQSGLATAANQTILIDGMGYITSVLMGSIADAGTAAETYQIQFGGATYTVDYSGLDATGNRGTTTRTKT